MTENPEESPAVSEEPVRAEPVHAEPVRDEAGREEPASDETDLSTKLDPDVIPQQGEAPNAKRAREHPEETGS
ncbi:hypothetical protein [Arthrobacter sp. K5]|jgi:hypothetical protein|uniref:Uncharacterized protein n=1 Tax=Arthrobacter sp. K5 TaxID=2839623 RepID=A0AAU8EU20_9MICC